MLGDGEWGEEGGTLEEVCPLVRADPLSSLTAMSIPASVKRNLRKQRQ